MALPKIRVNLEQKTFSIGDEKVKLEDNFVGAEVSKIKASPEQKALKLIYLVKKGFSSESEAEKIYLFLQEKELLKQIEVNSFPMQEYLADSSFPAVVVYGRMDAAPL